MAKQRRTSRRRGDDASEEAAPKGAADTGTMVSAEKNGVVGDAPAAAEDVVISARVHCDGCARKLRRSLQRLLDGAGEVSVDTRTNTVVVSGPGAVEHAAEAVEVVERKTGKKATLLSPSSAKLLPFPAAGKKKSGAGGDPGEDEIAAVDTEMVIVLRMNLHCDACCEEIKRRILKIEGVKDAAPLLKSSQMVVKGTVEPATLVGFIHRSTGRKAAITRAEPLDLLLPPTTKSPPLMEAEHETKHDDSSGVNSGEKKGEDHKEMNEAPPQEEEEEEENNGAGRQGDNNTDDVEKPRPEKPRDDDDGPGVEEDHHETHHDGGARTNGRFVQENHKKDDHLFRAPPPAGVITVAPEMTTALNSFNPYYYAYPSYPYAHQHHYYQCPAAPYPYYGYSPATYGYPHCPPEAPYSEEDPNACAIV